jgi:hypothetical protein
VEIFSDVMSCDDPPLLVLGVQIVYTETKHHWK